MYRMYKVNLPYKPELYQNGIDENKYSEKAYEREEKLKLFNSLRKEGCSEKTALKAIKISHSTLYRWKRNYKKAGLSGLEDQSRAPKATRSKNWKQEDIDLVLDIRRKNPCYGKEKIAIIIKRDHNKNISESMIGRILTHLKERGLITEAPSYKNNRRKKRNTRFKGHAQRWKYGSKGKKPGDLVQVDHMTYSENGRTIKEFSAVDPFTRVMFSQVYSNATSNTAARFLTEMLLKFPFDVTSIQVDGGSEFMSCFETLCAQLKIALHVLPPRRPQYNGRVERSNSTVKSEFYYSYDGDLTVNAIRPKLVQYLNKYNTYRPHKSLQGKTPMQYYQLVSL